MPVPILDSKESGATALRVESALALRLRGRRDRVAWSVHEAIDGDGLIDWAEQIAGALQAAGLRSPRVYQAQPAGSGCGKRAVSGEEGGSGG